MPSITGILMSESSRSNRPLLGDQISAARPPSSASTTSWPTWASARRHEGAHVVIVFSNQNRRHQSGFSCRLDRRMRIGARIRRGRCAESQPDARVAPARRRTDAHLVERRRTVAGVPGLRAPRA